MKVPITHRATVVALLSQSQPDSLQATTQIDEAIAQVGVVRGHFRPSPRRAPG